MLKPLLIGLILGEKIAIVTGIIFFSLFILMVSLLSSALFTIQRTALYHYAAERKIVTPFSEISLKEAFVPITDE